jgi:hypothetical protein
VNARVRVNEAGQIKQITRREALYKNLIAKALQGNPSAQRLLLQIMTETRRDLGRSKSYVRRSAIREGRRGVEGG